ncbi:Asp23/Gls24 family envelope stress response protein [Thermopolyspora sp. NPDC052614]|uniref:Asp23/Gls24 family envelope stress response protein n=1 Tax=Thermopolyspora sp. NPDC052614 TaxID=3155682 RepID=UPI00341D882F
MKGRIKVADEVVEKVVALATMEVPGVVAMGGEPERAVESVRDRARFGGRRAGQGVHVEIEDRQVAIDISIVVEYGRVILDVANEVKANVARAVSLMAGLRVVEVNVTVDDVRMPEAAQPE